MTAAMMVAMMMLREHTHMTSTMNGGVVTQKEDEVSNKREILSSTSRAK